MVIGTAGSSSTGTHLNPILPPFLIPTTMLSPLPFPRTFFRANRPCNDEVMLSVLRRAKVADFATVIVTLDTFLLGWCPHDLDTAYLPFAAGFDVQVDTSDPVFTQRQQLPPRPDETPHIPPRPGRVPRMLCGRR
jgi:hypothetical protein